MSQTEFEATWLYPKDIDPTQGKVNISRLERFWTCLKPEVSWIESTDYRCNNQFVKYYSQLKVKNGDETIKEKSAQTKAEFDNIVGGSLVIASDILDIYQDENDTSYVVVKRTYPNGEVIFTGEREFDCKQEDYSKYIPEGTKDVTFDEKYRGVNLAIENVAVSSEAHSRS